MARAHILVRDIGQLLSERSSQNAEILLRTQLEAYISFEWIGVGPGNRNYVLFVREDCLRTAKELQRIVELLRSDGHSDTKVQEWESIVELNLKQAAEVLTHTKFVSAGDKYPLLHERAKELDQRLNGSGNYLWIINNLYTTLSNSTHLSNRHLNAMHGEDDYIYLQGNLIECARVADISMTTHVGMLEDFIKMFEVEGRVDDLWERYEQLSKVD